MTRVALLKCGVNASDVHSRRGVEALALGCEETRFGRASNDLYPASSGDGRFPREAFGTPHAPLSSARESRLDPACGHWLAYEPKLRELDR